MLVLAAAIFVVVQRVGDAFATTLMLLDVALLLAWSARRAQRQVTVVIGVDGLLQYQTLGAMRFVPFGALAAVHRSVPGIVVVHFKDGARLAWYPLHSPTQERWAWLLKKEPTGPTSLGQLRRFGDELGAAFDTYQAWSDVAPVDGLARGGRSASQWIRDMRVIGARDADGTYRTPGVLREALWYVVENPKASIGVRVGASLALRVRCGDAGLARLVEVAGRFVFPPVGTYLEAISNQCEEAALDRLLAGAEEVLD